MRGLGICAGLVALVLSACGSHEDSDLIGAYEAAYNFGTARVVLEAGGGFIETMTLTGQEPKQIATGRWSYDAAASRLTLSNFSEIAYANGLPIPDDLIMNGPTTVPVEWNMDPLTLRLGRGEGAPFKKMLKEWGSP